jgi:hypothetical protein
MKIALRVKFGAETSFRVYPRFLGALVSASPFALRGGCDQVAGLALRGQALAARAHPPGAERAHPFRMRRQANGGRISLLLLGVFVVAGALTGCKSASQYISPRVEGRVVDAQTHQPIKGVKVLRLTPGQDPDVDQAPVGDTALEQTPDIRTGRDGSFVLGSERDLELFRRSGWDSVTIAFKHPGYQTTTTNYTLVNAIIAPGGEPLVKTGDIRLVPLSPGKD